MPVTTLCLMLLLAADAAPVAAPPPDARALYDRCVRLTEATYDTVRGGFVERGKPVESAVELSFLLSRELPNEPWKERAVRTVEYTFSLFDSIGGGYVHTPRSKDPGETRLEKRTDSNARRLENLMDAWDATGDPAYQKAGVRAVDFFDRVLMDGRGGFQFGQVGDIELYPEPNGYAIHAYVRWAAQTGEKRFLDFAMRSIERVWENCWEDNGGLLRKGTFGEVLKVPTLNDQVEMGRALLAAHQVGGRPQDLARARVLADLLLFRFEDPRGGFRTQSAPTKKGEVKKAARVDVENARAARFLYELAAATGEERYRAAGDRAWGPFLEDLDKSDAVAAAEWSMAARAAFAPTVLAPPTWPVAERNPAEARPRSFSIKHKRR
jgi:uncharacterized protein YyaL (SSP411 family)